MNRYQARVRGDAISDEIIAETPQDAARLFVQKIYDEDGLLREGDEAVIVEVNESAGNWMGWRGFNASAIHSVKFEIQPLET